jgi:hypothetical protein
VANHTTLPFRPDRSPSADRHSACARQDETIVEKHPHRSTLVGGGHLRDKPDTIGGQDEQRVTRLLNVPPAQEA